MQLSEFRDLLANDGFAATFQTMGQYRTELLRALDKLRAQADARPVAYQRRMRAYEREEWSDWHDVHEGVALDCEKTPTLNGWVYEIRPLYTHPEASAPGLSPDAIEKCRIEACDIGILHKGAAHRFAELLLTRPSAATVAEPSDVVDTIHAAWVAAGSPHDIVSFQKGWQANAAQQQAEPAADERALKQAVERLILEGKTVDYVLTNRKNPDDARRCFAEAADRVTKLLAAQSGQRAEDAARYNWLRSRLTGPLPMVRIQIMKRGAYKLIGSAEELDDRINSAPTYSEGQSNG